MLLVGPGEMNLEQVLQKMQEKLGGDPYPMRLLGQLVPQGVMDQARSSQFVETLPAIPMKYKMLMYVTAAAALGSEYCTKVYAQRAMREGATAQEIMEAVLIARFVSASTVFATAIPTMEMLLNLTSKEGGNVK
ncbi:MAG: carboxymuconolactone decarboxylase family protein [Moorellaceae bacterium]